MDEETRASFAGIRKLMNDQHERLIGQLNSLARDFQNTRGFLIDDALTLRRRITTVENRLDDLEGVAETAHVTAVGGTPAAHEKGTPQ